MNLSYFHLDLDLTKALLVRDELYIPGVATATGREIYVVHNVKHINERGSTLRLACNQGWNVGEYFSVLREHPLGGGSKYRVWSASRAGDNNFRIEPADIMTRGLSTQQDPEFLGVKNIESLFQANEDLFLAYEQLVADYNATKASEDPFTQFQYTSVYSGEIVSANVRYNLETALLGEVQHKNFGDYKNAIYQPHSSRQWVRSYDQVEPLFDEADLNNKNNIDFGPLGWVTSIFFEFDHLATSEDDILSLHVDFYPERAPSSPESLQHANFKFLSGADWSAQRETMLQFWRDTSRQSLSLMRTMFEDGTAYYQHLLDKYINNPYKG